MGWMTEYTDDDDQHFEGTRVRVVHDIEAEMAARARRNARMKVAPPPPERVEQRERELDRLTITTAWEWLRGFLKR